MKRCIVQTKGDFVLLNTTGEAIESHRPTVVAMTSFVETRLQKDELKVFARHLPREATDEEFREFLKESENDVELAVNSFCAKFGINPDGENLDVELENEDKTLDADTKDQKDEDSDVKEDDEKGEGSEENEDNSEAEDTGTEGEGKGEQQEQEEVQPVGGPQANKPPQPETFSSNLG